MIQVFSNYFKVKENCYHDFEWFISDVVDLEVIKDENGYAFSGLSQGYLTEFAIDLSCAEETFLLTKDDYRLLYEGSSLEEDDDPLVLVFFHILLSKLIEDSVKYVEVDLEHMSGYTTKLFSTGDSDYKSIYLSFGNEGRL